MNRPAHWLPNEPLITATEDKRKRVVVFTLTLGGREFARKVVSYKRMNRRKDGAFRACRAVSRLFQYLVRREAREAGEADTPRVVPA